MVWKIVEHVISLYLFGLIAYTEILAKLDILKLEPRAAKLILIRYFS